MKKRIFMCVLCALIFVMCACSDTPDIKNDTNAVKYETAEELAEKFMSVCKDSDIEAMYDLYYDNMLDDMYERTKNNLTREQFNEYIISEMSQIADYELSEYGVGDMVTTSSPLFNLNYIYYRSTGTETGFTEDMVTSCANMRVYMTFGGYSDHIFAEINGSWYIVL